MKKEQNRSVSIRNVHHKDTKLCTETRKIKQFFVSNLKEYG